MRSMRRTAAMGTAAVAALFLLSTLSGIAASDYSTNVDLIAGQHTDVGQVEVYDDGTYLYVKFTTDEPWVMTETHVDVELSPAGFPTNKGNNPKIGWFEFGAEHDYVDEYTEVITLKAEWDGEDLYVAAHAVVVEKLSEAPWYGSEVIDYWQGAKKDGGAVNPGRSVPEQGLEYESAAQESSFFSLGFGGWIIIGFGCDIINGDGYDVKVWEDTWGTYPSETAEVYASQDGSNWVDLGQADNSNFAGIHTVTYFDLGTLEWAKYIMVVDTTNPAVHNNAADGYDLNAVEVLHACYSDDDETAWAGGDAGLDFGGSSWATYFEVPYSVA